MLQRALLLAAICLLAAAPALSQNDKPPDAKYLARLQRIHDGKDVCILVQTNGRYHMERKAEARSAVAEDTLPTSDLVELGKLVNQEKLREISQQDVPFLMSSDSLDFFSLGVFRVSGWQNLRFNTSESRQPYHDLLDPLLKWLSAVEKRKQNTTQKPRPRDFLRAAVPDHLGRQDGTDIS
jgi:hypothetical protein